VFRFVSVCNVFWVEFQRYCCRCGGGSGGGGGGRDEDEVEEEEVSLGVIMTRKFTKKYSKNEQLMNKTLKDL
jgi:hypothetical protein